MNNRTVFSHSSDEWETPQELFNELDQEFHFTLDPCATDKNRKCRKYYTEKENGIEKKWNGEIVFCNPPYSEIKRWVEKSFKESQTGCTVVLLIPSRTDTRWFHEYIYGKAEIRFLKGRLKFSGARYNAPFPSMVVIMRGGGMSKGGVRAERRES